MRKIYRDKKVDFWLPRAEENGWRDTVEGFGVSFGDDKNVLNLMAVMVSNSVNILKTTELYTLNG